MSDKRCEICGTTTACAPYCSAIKWLQERVAKLEQDYGSAGEGAGSAAEQQPEAVGAGSVPAAATFDNSDGYCLPDENGYIRCLVCREYEKGGDANEARKRIDRHEQHVSSLNEEASIYQARALKAEAERDEAKQIAVKAWDRKDAGDWNHVTYTIERYRKELADD